ncbi:Histone deacetylase complex subunit [Exophiala xenobiotica]|nr:Histone deacetylase complex subunit [Exophiala xenobiotica]
MSPRRSSRARSSQQPPTAPTHTSSTPSNNSKPDRDTRTGNRNNSPRIASTHRSESVDGGDSNPRAEQLAPRRSRRNGEEKEPAVKQQVEHGDEDAGPEATEEEVTRCICGQAEYPGPSASLRQQQPNPEALTDDTGNFFVQCDKCGVWQHGGCMGLLDESLLPDEYYCEQCKPEYHKISRSPNGQRSSRYVPVPEPISTRSSPLTSGSDLSHKKDDKSRQLESTKRRATMNSRGAYDEDEMLRRAIEESKEMGTLGKRGRDDSEDHKGNPKRQRTGSDSSSTVSKHSQSPDPSGEEPGSKSGTSRSNKLRGTAARNNREKELREKQKEQQAQIRAEAASKRLARSERRRVEDSPPPTPSLSPSKAVQANGKKADSPPSGRSNNSRRNAKPAARRGRLGRNQYTRDQVYGEDGTPARDASRDVNGNGGSPPHGIHGESGRSSKAKTHPARTSLNEMRRRVAAILEFVGHMQTERSVQSHQSSASSKGTSTPNGVKEASALPTASLVRAVEAGLKEAESRDEESGLSLIDHKEFGTMGSQDMMETLAKELVQWQSVYGMYSR